MINGEGKNIVWEICKEYFSQKAGVETKNLKITIDYIMNLQNEYLVDCIDTYLK